MAFAKTPKHRIVFPHHRRKHEQPLIERQCVCIRALCGCIVLYGQSIKSVMFANRLRIKDLKYKNNYHYLYYTEDIKAVKFFCKKICFIFDILSIHVLL